LTHVRRPDKIRRVKLEAKHMTAASDVIVIVPKQDELYWLGLAFGFDFTTPDRFLPYRAKPVYDRLIRDISGNDVRIAFVAMDAQGNTESALITSQSVQILNPTVAFLIGTGLGNPKRCGVADVVFSEKITDISETKALDEGVQSWRSRHIEPAGRMRRDVGRFREALNISDLQARFYTFASEHLQTQISEIPPMPGAVHLESIASGDVVIANPDLADQIWRYDDRLSCYDMESGGFARALDTDFAAAELPDQASKATRSIEEVKQRRLEWMVIRGISDFGDQVTKTSYNNRHIASAVAGIVLREFLESGLKECHPFQLRPPTDSSAEIPSTHFYVRRSGTHYFRERIREDLGIELPADQPSRHRTVGALAALLYPVTGRKREELSNYLNDVRERFFEEKYLDYSYEHDLRSLLPGWALEFRDIVRGELNMPRGGLVVLDVGVGNGLELQPLFGETGVIAASVTAVDVSNRMLAAAREHFPALRAVHAIAEDLVGIDSRSIDLYVSLRTYMSRLFDITRALEEAVRVLRPDGGIVLSIANGYVVEDEERPRQLVRGLTVSGGDAVDADEPHAIAFRIRRQMWDFGFESVGYHSSATDVYLWGRAPKASGPRVSSLPVDVDEA
jgi:SAM-dependent methyltransferase/nucleoside phosphorylase